MRILHYTLGLFPYRSGGLTRYTSDLMQAQSKKPEDQISLLYPGDISLINTKRHIARRCSYGKVKVYEIKNPSIVPLLHGVKSPTCITRNKNTLSEEKLEWFYLQNLFGAPVSNQPDCGQLVYRKLFRRTDRAL